MFNILATCRSACSLRIFAMAFFTVFVCYMTVGEGVSSLAIYEYMPNTNKVGTRLFGPAVLLKALNAIYRAVFLLIPGSLTTIIW